MESWLEKTRRTSVSEFKIHGLLLDLAEFVDLIWLWVPNLLKANVEYGTPQVVNESFLERHQLPWGPRNFTTFRSDQPSKCFSTEILRGLNAN